MAKKLIMSWSKCFIRDAAALEDGTMPAVLKALGIVNDKSTSLEATDGEELKATASGGVLVAYEQLEGGYQLTFRIKEPSNELYESYGLAKAVDGDLEVKTHVVSGYRAVEVSPKNVGGKGIRAANCIVKFKPGRSEDEGEYADITYIILPILNEDYEVAKWYTRFTKKAILVVAPLSLSFTAAADTTGQSVTATATGDMTSISASADWITVTKTGKIAKVKVSANTGSARSGLVTMVADGKTTVVPVDQAGV